MSFNISEFVSKTNKHGFAKNNLFIVRITGNAPIQAMLENATLSGRNMPLGDLVFYCRSADLPGFQVQTQDVFPQAFGTPDRRPASMQFQPFNSVFMVDSNFAVLKFFNRWIQSMVNYDKTNSLGEVNGALPFELGYKEDYTATIEVIVYSVNDEKITYTYRMENAYPVSTGNITTAWENSAEIMTLPVTFSYDTIKVDGQAVGIISDLVRGTGLVQFLSSLDSVTQAIDMIKRPRNIQDIVNATEGVRTIRNVMGI